MHSDIFERMNELVGKYGEKGLVLLFIFKTLKNSVLEHLEDKNPETDWTEFEDDINRECIEISKEILKKGQEHPNEEDIKKVLELIKER